MGRGRWTLSITGEFIAVHQIICDKKKERKNHTVTVYPTVSKNGVFIAVHENLAPDAFPLFFIQKPIMTRIHIPTQTCTATETIYGLRMRRYVKEMLKIETEENAI